MNEMMFTISLLSKDNGSILKEKIIVSGEELEEYIHCSKNINDRHLFDGTDPDAMFSEEYHQRMNMYSQFSLSQESRHHNLKDPPEESSLTFYNM